MKPNVQTLFARILEDIRAEMDEAETLYLKLCQTAITGMVQMPETDSASSSRKIDLLSAQYEERLQSIIQDTMTVYRRPIQVFPVADSASLIETMEIYNNQFEELERILDQLRVENSIPKNNQPTKIQAQNQSIWKSIVNSIDLKKEFGNQIDETASPVKRPASPASGYTGCNKHLNNRKVPTMKKPNILICGPNQIDNASLLSEATPAGTIPENTPDDDSPEEDGGFDGKPEKLIRRIVETPVANFIEANELSAADNEGDFYPSDLTMDRYLKDVEAELRSNRLPPGKDAKIDVIWICTGYDFDFIDENGRDFIRSAAGVPNTLVIANPTIVSNRVEFKKGIDSLVDVAGRRRVVLAPSACSGMNFSTLSSGMHYLLEKTRLMYLDSVDASDEEREACEDAWSEFFSDKLDEWQEALDDSLSSCIEQAAGRANFILNKTADVSLTDLVEEGIDLLGELVDILKGRTDIEDKPGKTALAHTAELKENIELLIYEIAACYGQAATAHDVETVLRHSKASLLPKDAAAITYAVGQVAKAVFELGTEYSSKDLLVIYREAKEEAMRMEFPPYDDEHPFDHPDSSFELDEKDLDESDAEQEDCDADIENESGDDVHEPADELPEDCRVDDELKPSDD